MVVLDHAVRRTINGHADRRHTVELTVRLADEHRISGDHETVETEKPADQLALLVLVAIDESIFKESLYTGDIAVVGRLNALAGRWWTGP